MATVPPLTSTTSTFNNDLFAAVDMGTNSFKLTVARIDPSSGRLFTLHRFKQSVLLGLDTTILSAASLDRSIEALKHFQSKLHSRRIPSSNLRIVATSAVRESSNKSEFLLAVNETLGDGNQVEIISGQEEARLTYLGILQYLPLFSSTILAIDIGGGSTEFTIGFEGNILFSQSLRLGHVTLTKEFNSNVAELRKHVRNVLESSGLIEKLKEFKVDSVVGSSGTIKAIEKAVRKGYVQDVEENVGGRKGKFNKEGLRFLVEKMCHEEKEIELNGGARRKMFFKRRSEFILAGTTLLDEVFERLGINEIEVSRYALGEGVITEMLGRVFNLNVNAKWNI